MKHLVLVRHGESDWNAQRRIQGQSGTGLSRRGHEQAVHLATELASTYPDARLVVSDLQRCRETATPGEARIGRRAIVDADLRERDFGAWTGRLVTEVEADDPERFARWAAGHDVLPEVGGEDSQALRDRVLAAIDRHLAEVDDGGALVCITHGGPVWNGTRALVDLHEEALGGVANASVTELLVDGSFGWRLAHWNQVGHLPPDVRSYQRRVERARRDGAPPAGR